MSERGQKLARLADRVSELERENASLRKRLEPSTEQALAAIGVLVGAKGLDAQGIVFHVSAVIRDRDSALRRVVDLEKRINLARAELDGAHHTRPTDVKPTNGAAHG